MNMSVFTAIRYCFLKYEAEFCKDAFISPGSVILVFSFLLLNCQNIIKPNGTMTGKEAREYVRKKLLPITLIDASLASSSNLSDKVSGTYEVTFDILIPSMLKVDDNAYYSEKKVKACADQIFKTSLQLTSSLAVFQCSLKPVPAVYFGDF